MILTFDRVILHTIVHHSSTSTYMTNFIEMKKLFVGGPTLLDRLKRVHLKMGQQITFCMPFLKLIWLLLCHPCQWIKSKNGLPFFDIGIRGHSKDLSSPVINIFLDLKRMCK